MKNNRFIVVVLASLITALALLALPIDFARYLLHKAGMAPAQRASSILFADVTGSGYDELLGCNQFLYGGEIDPACMCLHIDKNFNIQVLDQLNVPDLITGPKHAGHSNYNHNAYKEVLIAAIENGHLWLHVYEGPKLTKPIRRIHIDTLHYKDDKAAIGFYLHAQYDRDGDGYDEVLVSFMNGFPMYPRRNYLVDIHRGSCIASPATSVGFVTEHVDILSNGQRVLTGGCNNPGNDHHENTLPYSDMHAYVYAFNDSLQFLFEPIKVVDYPGRASSIVLGDQLLSYVYHNSGTDSRAVVQKRDIHSGRLLDSIEVEAYFTQLHKHAEGLCISANGVVLMVDSALNITRKIEDERLASSPFHLDLTGDGRTEFVTHKYHTGRLNIWDADFAYPVEIDFPHPTVNEFFVANLSDGKRYLAYLDGEAVHFLHYSANPWYWLRWPYYIGVLGLSLLFSAFLFGKFRRNIEQRYQQERELARLQVLALKNQVDPHFTLNALNAIDQMYRSNEPERASDFMAKLTRLVYATVRDSDKATTSLQNELDFCRNFCALEGYRSPDFSYTIHVEEGIDLFAIRIPKQFVFTHVQNALKHGLRLKAGPKQLDVRVQREADAWLLVSVHNNGLPFGKNSQTQGTGKGLKLLDQMVEVYEKLEKRRIGYQIAPGSDGGTLAEIRLEWQGDFAESETDQPDNPAKPRPKKLRPPPKIKTKPTHK